MNDFLTFRGDYCFFLKGELSQWWRSPFTYKNICFNNCEQWMMWSKAILFNDSETAQKILNAKTPFEQKALGREVKNFNQQIWDLNKREIVKQGNILKYDSNPNLKEILLSTKPFKLVEANEKDRIWGIGKYVEDPYLMNEDEWGENLLGKILTEIRDSY